MIKVFALVVLIVSFELHAQSVGLSPYQSTENAGLNRIERLEHVETYLKSLSQSLSSMEIKIQENSKVLLELGESVKILKSNEIKKEEANSLLLAEASVAPIGQEEEISLLKADILKLKNSDIKNLNTEIQGLHGVIRNLETILRATQDK